MVAEEHRIGLYISVPVYFCILVGCAFWAHRRMEKMEHDKTSDKLAAHYLGGQDFGPLLTAGTVFASLFSGYTVIGIPNEAYKGGWGSLRWLATLWAIVFGYFGTGLRLRKSSNIRNHQSPVDFITDRFQSQFLRYMVVFLQVVPSITYLAAQVNAIKGTFNAMFELDSDSALPVIFIMAIILIFEWVGGLNSVAASDSLQALVMCFAFVAVPSIMARQFVGWKDLDPFTYPRPQYYQTPTRESQWQFWQFSLVNFSFFTLPHLMQRTYAAKDLSSLKAGYTVMTVAGWFTSPVGCFIGTVGVEILKGKKVASPFSSIMEALMDEGGFSKAVGIIAVTASLAAIMSTADSLVIAVSQLVTVEIVYPLRPKASPREIGWIGRFVSLLAVIIALLIGLFWKEGISDMGKIQFPISAQAVPAFLFGLYGSSRKTDIHPWCIAAGALSATVYVIGVYFGYQKGAVEAVPINSGITGFALQIALILFFEGVRRVLGISQSSYASESHDEVKEGHIQSTSSLLFPKRPKWDIPKLKRFGEHTFTPELVWKSMEGVDEPIASPMWAFLMFFAITVLTPLVAENQPPLDVATGTFSALAPPSTIGGIPWWAAKILFMSLVPFFVLLFAIWKMPNNFPLNEKRIQQEGINPDLVELTNREKGNRDSYDSQNLMIQSRRSLISASMKDLGLERVATEDIEKLESRRKLSALILANELTQEHVLDNVPKEQEQEQDEQDIENAAPQTNKEQSVTATTPGRLRRRSSVR